MEVIKQATIPLNRMLFIPKDGNLKLEDLVIETEGPYQLFERGDCFVVKNDDCCRSINVTVKRKG
ncbi:MAG: hypothetical protein QHH02_09505 [Syntrophomonadaceae bacterium]|nr:hypothetical protein [Syntrophomonadaceae bacterium]